MVLAANVGPKGDSDGSHAVGLVTRLGTTNAAIVGQPPGVAGSIVQSTMATNPAVTDSSMWAAKDAAPTLSVTLGRDAFGDLPSLPANVEVEKQSGHQDIPMLEGYHSAALEHKAPGGTTVYAAVYSDIGPGSTKPSLLASVPSLNFRSIPAVSKALGQPSAGTRVVALTLPIAYRTPPSSAHNEVKTDSRNWETEVAVNAGVPVTFVPWDHDSNPTTPDVTRGYLKCTSSPCESQERNGVVELMGTWAFHVEEPVPDSEYLTFGAWLSVPDEDDGRFDLGVFASGKMPATNYAGLGTAIYKGPATGIYARGEYRQASASQQGRAGMPAVESARVGAFAAEATLEADFGRDISDDPVVSGHIRKFVENGKSIPGGNWSVELKQTDGTSPGVDGVGQLHTGDTGGEADGRRLMGKWGVQFFKDGNEKALPVPMPADPAEAKAANLAAAPGYAAGTFSASTLDEDTPQKLDALHIVGAFGANKQAPQPQPQQ
jgi:hypothetical protein